MFSTVFLCDNGVKQDGALSPTLFCIYVDELLCRLRESGIGCHIENDYVGSLCYADDVTLLALSRSALDTMISNCETFAKEYFVKFNPDKSILIVFTVPNVNS
jgi:hypothetical protein